MEIASTWTAIPDINSLKATEGALDHSFIIQPQKFPRIIIVDM